jgi:hypothetical protein
MNDELDDVTQRVRQALPGRGGSPELTPDLIRQATDRPAPRLANPRRRLQLAGGAAFAVAAVTVGALVVASPFQRAPLFVAAAGAPESALSSEDDGAANDLRIGSWIDYQYVPGSGLSTSGGSGSVYQLRLDGSAEDTLRTVAAALGFEGEITESEYSAPEYPTFVMGPEDGTAASVVVSWVGTGSWWYSDPAAYPPLECSTASSDGDGDVTVEEREDCVVPEPSIEDSLAPSEAEARAQARTIFAATGLEVAASDIRVTADAWQTMATASLRVDGVQTALDWGIAWSANGRIAWAYGHSIEVVDRGEFGTVSATAAVDRLSDWRWFGAAGPDYQGGMYILADDAVAAQEAEADPDAPVSSDPGSEGTEGEGSQGEPAPEEPPAPDGSGEEPGVEPEPDPGVEPDPGLEPEPVPEPEVVVVEITEAQSTLLLMWDSEGNAWLVPGFAMQHPDGWWNTVVSLVEGVIQLPEPIEFEPLIMEDGARIAE